MKRIVFIILLLLSNEILAQRYFSRMYDLTTGWESAFGVLKYDTNELIISGSTIDFNATDSLLFNRVYISKVKGDGTYQNKYFFAEKYGWDVYYNGVQKEGNKARFIVLRYDSFYNFDNYHYDAKIVYLTENCDTIKSYTVEKPNSTFGGGWIGTLIQNKLYFGGANTSYNTSPLAMLCTDTLGKKIWYKQYTKRYRINNVVMSNDNNLLIGGFLYRGDGVTDTVFGWYAQMDIAGNILWEKVMDGKNTFLADNAWVSNANDNFYVSGGNGGYPFSVIWDSSYAYIASIDSLGNVKWRKNFLYTDKDKTCGVGTFVCRNNYLYAYVNYNTSEGWANQTQYVTLVKLDMQGNLKWKRLFKQWYKDNRGWSVTVVPDGFIICADGKDSTHTTGFTDAWIIKTDTNGCIIPGCNLHDGIKEIIDSKNYLTLYPNPTSNKISVAFNDPRQTKIEKIEIFDEKGQMVLTKEIMVQHGSINSPYQVHHDINIEQLNCGMYYLAAYFDGDKRVVKKFVVEK